ncbi:MAG: phytanoyl-CoA dioxygenase family protein [Planctomycetes bacterium]|nr:phytanoyl-CoA dioxygenase family protein [Planctomycetota bacterium]
MPLTPQQIEQFRTQGYLVVPDLFSTPEVHAMQAEVERFKREDKFRNVATDGDGKTHSSKQRNLQICPTYKISNFFRALPFDPKVVEAVSGLIGDPFLLHLDQIFLKPAGDGMGTNWHQDNAYFKIADPLKGTAMWIAVHDATVANGTLRVIPNMFREELPHERDPMSDHHIRCYPDETHAQVCEVKAGGVVFFCYGTPHSTAANHTDKDRAGFAYHFLHESVAAGTSYGDRILADGRDYNPFLTGPKASGGLKEYGSTVAGTWPIEVAKALDMARQVEAVGAR